MMGQTPVTQRLYEKVMGENPSYFQHSNDNLDAEQRDALECNTANNPVENVSWFDAVYFCSQRYLFANTPLRQAQGAAIFRQAKERQFFCYTEASSLSLLQRYVFGNKPFRQAQVADSFCYTAVPFAEPVEVISLCKHAPSTGSGSDSFFCYV